MAFQDGQDLCEQVDACYKICMLTARLLRRDRPARSTSRGFVLGRDRFAKISAVEGIALTRDMREALEGFDREGLSAAERRRAIVMRFTPLR